MNQNYHKEEEMYLQAVTDLISSVADKYSFNSKELWDKALFPAARLEYNEIIRLSQDLPETGEKAQALSDASMYLISGYVLFACDFFDLEDTDDEEKMEYLYDIADTIAFHMLQYAHQTGYNPPDVSLEIEEDEDADIPDNIFSFEKFKSRRKIKNRNLR